MKLENLSLKYQNTFLFKDLNLNLAQDQWISILGKSGSGKSTLIHLLAGLDSFCDISGTIHNKQSSAWMGQEDLLYPWLSILDNVLLPCSVKNKAQADNIALAKKYLSKVGITDRYHEYPEQFSGGQRQRIALARTLMSDAEIILMDEPFSALDAITKQQCQNLFNQLLRNKTVLMVTHDVNEAIRLSDSIYLLQESTASLELIAEFNSPRLRDIDNAEYAPAYQALWNALEQKPEAEKSC